MSQRACCRGLAGVVLGAYAATATATTFTVTSVADSGPGTLRQAILTAGADTTQAHAIAFAIPGMGPFTIQPLTRLPNLKGVLTIDGYTQPGSLPNTRTPDQGGLDAVPLIEIRGPGNGFGLVVETNAPAATITLRGLVINGFAPHIGGGRSGSRLVVQGSFIGTTLDGMAAVAATSTGCVAVAGDIQIGGLAAAARNLIANCGNGAIQVSGGHAVIEGNLIGTDVHGERQLPGSDSTNNNGGIVIGSVAGPAAVSVRVGGATPAARNVISGHRAAGIALYGTRPFEAYSELVIQGNFIGTDWSGTRAIPNGFPDAPQFSAGILLVRVAADASAVRIGGFAPGEANLIAYNHGAGIRARNANTAESFDNRGNLIHHNRGFGADVDIAPVGPNADDPGDADIGANNLQNRPQIAAVVRTGNQLQITYRVDSTTSASTYPLRIDFHENVQGGSGALLGQDSYPSVSAGQWRTVNLSIPVGARGLPLVAAATDANGYSSELSAAFDVIFENDFE